MGTPLSRQTEVFEQKFYIYDNSATRRRSSGASEDDYPGRGAILKHRFFSV